MPIVSGGTGLYLRALLEGLFPGPQRSEELRNKLRGRAQKHGTEHLHRILRRLDSSAADRIHANDVAKVIRAIEVCLASRQSSRPTSRRNMTELWQEGREPLQGFRILRLGLNPEREVLYARINQRAAKMFDQGLIAETEMLLAKYGAQARPLASLGYKQARSFCAANWIGRRRSPRRSRRIVTMPSARSHGSGENRMCIGWPGSAMIQQFRRIALQRSSSKFEGDVQPLKGASDLERLPVSLKRYPDTNPKFLAACIANQLCDLNSRRLFYTDWLPDGRAARLSTGTLEDVPVRFLLLSSACSDIFC